MIVVFTSIENGGILQLANQIALTFKRMNRSCKLLIPAGAKRICSENLTEEIVEYDLPKTINANNAALKCLAKSINDNAPELFLAVDDAIRANLLLKALNKKITKAVIVHDVTPHPQYFNIRGFLVEYIRSFYRKGAFSASDRIVLLSSNSEARFVKRYRRFAKKRTILPLGAHLIPASPVIPVELEPYKGNRFVLFFGRIDKYKGVERLVEAHRKAKEDSEYDMQLVIAGKPVVGEQLSMEETVDTSYLLRYITDGEMQWLFEHCSVVALPYLEASQSGVLPIAYKFGKPVIVSNISGLRELVVQGTTGEVFLDDDDLKLKLKEISRDSSEKFNKETIQDFYKQEYDWEKNLENLIRELNASRNN